MLDFSVTFNIIYTAVTGALGLFMLVSLIAVAAVGKRRCNAFDVILRILASLSLAAAVVLVAAAVLVRLDGAYAISVSDGTASLVFGAQSFALPLPELFSALRTVMGLCLAGALFVFSMVALICDCTIANKKKKRELKVTNSVKTPEQRRIAAEVAKIRAIGNSAVRRTAAAAGSADVPVDTKTDDVQSAGAPVDEHVDTATDAPTDNSEKPTDESTAPDWRATERHSDFVGLNSNTDPDLDTFDSFDEFVGAGDGDTETATESVDSNSETDDVFADDALDDAPSDNDIAPDDMFDYDETDDADDTYDADDDRALDGDEEQPTAYAEPDADETNDAAEELADAQTDGAANDDDDDTDDVTGGIDADDDTVDDTARKEPAAAREPDEDYAPNRNIYFPRVRTISRYTEERPAAKRTAAKSDTSGAKPAARSKPAAQTAKKPTAQKRSSASKPAAKSEAGRSGDSRKLPVNRRYVIIDRRSAVNMFGDYLRERDGESKDKLKSSISTIILK